MSNLIEILHRVSNQLSEITEEIQIYEIMNEGIKEIFPDVYFLITKLQPDDMNFRVIHSFGFDKSLHAIKSLFGKDPYQIDFPYSDMSEFQQSGFEVRKLYHFSNGVYDLMNGMFSKPICRAFEKILGISDVHAVSLVVEDKYFGGAVLLIPKSSVDSGDLSQDKVLAIETIAAQASQVILNLRDIKALKEKDEELVISQSKFNQLVNQLNDVVWKADGDGTNIIDLTDSFESVLGYPSSEFEQDFTLFKGIIHPEDKRIFTKAYIDLIRSGKTDCEYRIIKPDGSLLWINDRRAIVYDSKGKPIQMGGVASDITEKKALEEQLQLKNCALDNSPSAIGIANLKGETIYVNDAFVELWGCDSKADLLGMHFSEFSTIEDSPQETYETIMGGHIYNTEDETIRKDGTTFNFIISASLIHHKQKPVCLMAVLTDITERKLHENIQRENEANLLALNNEKDKFLSIISHDLRSPFNGMLGLLEIMANDYYKFSDEERLNIIKSSYSSATKVCNLLTDLLEWARIQTNKIEIRKETVNLRDSINEAIALYSCNAAKKEIEIISKDVHNIQASIDVNSLTTIIRNLLVNAIKFTDNGGEVEFKATLIKSDIELSIKDNGVGMSKETQDKLFRLDENITMPGTNNEKGTGLGLNICKDLVSLNGWKMDIESQLGNGSTFKILIPQEA